MTKVFVRNTVFTGSEQDHIADFCGDEISEFVEELST